MIEINNLVNFKTDKKIFSTVAKKILLSENKGKQTISLAFVSKGEIKKLNKIFRKKNSVTDVLSFELNQGNLLGEIIICPEAVKENAKSQKVFFKSEMQKVFVHGVLHLCGYEHEKSKKQADIMEAMEKKYLSLIK